MNLLELFAPIRTFIFDVDGVLTNGCLTITEQYYALRTYHARDTYAIKTATENDYQVWLVCNEHTESVLPYAGQTGAVVVTTAQLTTLLQGVSDHVLYMGDDLPDLAAMHACALPCCPNDAVNEVRQYAKYISPQNGGQGCVRDVIEKVLKLNGHWDIPASR